MGRAPCCDKDGLKKGPWLPEEDQKLIDYIQKHGPGNWRSLPKKAGLQRCGKSCRLRWTNYLRPDIKRGRFSFEEEETIIQLHSILGNRWSAIAAKLPGRTDNEIKNYWNTHIKKRLLRMGIDPVTHTRRLDVLDIPSIFNHSLQNSQVNLLNLLGLVNPDQLLKLNYLFQNLQAAQQLQLPNSSTSQLQDQFNPVEQIPSNQVQIQPNLSHQYPTNISGFDAQNFGAQVVSGLNDQWASISNNVVLGSESAAAAHQNYVTDDSTLESDKSKQSLSLISSSSSQKQTPVGSNSVCNPHSSSSRSQDEIDSYCDSLVNFDVLFDIISGCTPS